VVGERDVQVRLVWLATLSMDGDTRWTRYEKFPELSVEASQAKVTLFSVVAVTCKLVGVVGGVRSFAARAGDGLRSNASTISTAVTPFLNVRKYRLFIFFSL
jgi:hypothetical protein